MISFTEVSLSDDIYRYFFDSYLIKNGLNPYLYPPNSLEIANISKNYQWLGLINNSSIKTPYPPVILFITFIISIFIGNDLLLWRLILSFLVFFAGLIIKELLVIKNQHPNYIIIWSLSPLTILEISHSGHNDIFPIIFVILALYLLYRKDNVTNKSGVIAGLLFSLSIGSKLYPIVFVPFFLIKLKKIGSFTLLISSAFQFAIYHLLTSNVTTGLEIYIRYWRFNGGIYEVIVVLSNFIIKQSFSKIISLNESVEVITRKFIFFS
ncbi:MAG: glycosyltransferase 87 family protein, partial [Candidatus Hodarchaeales archaeon]